MEYYNLIFAVFYLWRLAITTIDKQSCFFIIIFAVFLPNDKPNDISNTTSTQMDYFILRYVYLEKDILEIKRLNCLTSNFLGFDVDLWLRLRFESPRDFLCIFYWHFFSTSYRFWEIVFKVCRLRLWPFSLYRTVFEIFDYTVFSVWLWPLILRGYLRSKIFCHSKAPT